MKSVTLQKVDNLLSNFLSKQTVQKDKNKNQVGKAIENLTLHMI